MSHGRSNASRDAHPHTDPRSAARHADLALSHEKVGDVVLTQGDAAGALAEHRTALSIRAALLTEDPLQAGEADDAKESGGHCGNGDGHAVPADPAAQQLP